MKATDPVVPVPTDLKGLIETTGASLIQQMRDVVNPPGKRGSWLKDLSDKRLAEVYHRLKRLKQPPLQIAKLAQSEWGVMRGSNPVSLSRAVYTLRDKMLKHDLKHYSELESPTTVQQKQTALDVLGKRGQRVLDKVDWMGTMNWVMNEQVERIAQLRAKEIGLGMPLKMTEQAVSNFGALFAKMSEVCFRLGLWDSKPSEFNLNFKHTLDGVFAKVLTNDGVPMLEATSKFRDKLEEECLTFELSEDGSYKMKNKEGATVDVGKLEADSEEASG